jgi:hypothetical protein
MENVIDFHLGRVTTSNTAAGFQILVSIFQKRHVFAKIYGST